MGENTPISEPHKSILKVRNHLGLEDVHYSLVYEGLPDEFTTIAEKELRETEHGRKQGIQMLKECIKNNHMPAMKDNLLLAVLRNCKYDMKKSEVRLKNFINARSEAIRLLSTLETEIIENILDDMAFGMLPYRDKYGRVILYTRPYALKSDLYEVKDIATVFLTAGLFILSFPITTVAGLTYFGECKSDSLYIFYSIFSAFRKHMFRFFSYPLRVSRVEVLNENSLCRCFFNIISPIVSKKIINRVTLHGSNFESFYQMYNPDILPEEFGGKMGPISNEVYRQKFLDFVKDLRNEGR